MHRQWVLPCFTLFVIYGGALAQQGPAATSSLLGVPLAPRAIRVTDAAATREFAGLLRNVASSQAAACTTSEFLVWEGDMGDQVSGSLATQLTARQLTLKVLEETKTEDSASLSFLLTGREGRHAGVMYASSESVVLGWCRLAARPTASVPSVPQPAQAPKPGALATAKTSAPPVGDYSCLNADSLVYAFKLSILPGLKYQVQSGKVGAFAMTQEGRGITWTSGTLKDYGWPGWYLAPGAPDNMRGSSKNRHVIVMKIDNAPGTPFDAKPPFGSLLSCYPVNN